MSGEGRPVRARLGFPAGLLLFLLLLVFWRPDLGGIPERMREQGYEPRVAAVTAAVTALMALWWMTEAIPIPVTSMLPLVLFPLLAGDRFRLDEVARNYANSRVYLFFGGFLIAIAVQRWGLHRRIALHLVRRIGTSPRRLVLGFMVATAFLSMWISNTATSLMMLPIGIAVLGRFEGRREFAAILMLGIAYGANIGGMGTLVGTPPNISFQGQYRSLFPDAPPVTFARWLGLGLPLVLLFLPIAWLLLAWRLPRGERGDARSVLDEEIAGLGRMSVAERRGLYVFVLTAVLWIFRKPIDLGFLRVPGWSEPLETHFGNRAVDDGVVALATGLSLFLLPSGEGRPLLSWPEARNGMPWGILLLFGGGFALAAAIRESGLSAWVAVQFGHLEGVPPWLMMGAAATALTFLTEVTSNTATAEVMLPLAAVFATEVVQVDPLVLMLPVTLAASCAFMLPVATPPNAVVFGSGKVPMGTMVRYGFLVNLVGIALVTLVCAVLGRAVLGIDFDSVPAWARP